MKCNQGWLVGREKKSIDFIDHTYLRDGKFETESQTAQNSHSDRLSGRSHIPTIQDTPTFFFTNQKMTGLVGSEQ
jgi:hypothetical protein